ncbi:MAG: C69 family dipeptidase [Candidatus Thorarchaeota archaeon]
MCDTVVAIGQETKDGSVLFGKNSNRDPNECQNVIHIPRKKHDLKVDDKIKVTYIEIPQVEETFEVILSVPFWIWGAEMGANEFGVVIGNESIWTKAPEENQSLLGMDLLRLGLERGRSALDAMNIITTLLEEFGQGGEAGYTRSLKCHNSFIIADSNEAWVLETADKFWIAEKVTGIRTISNCLTIGNKYDKIHQDLIKYAIENKLCKNEDKFDFAKNFSKNTITSWGAKGDARRACTLRKLSKNSGELTIKDIFDTLRTHDADENNEKHFSPNKGSMKNPCLHASSFITPHQSIASMASQNSKNNSIHWFTGTSSPCTSLFKPFVTGSSTDYFQGGKYYQDESLWYKHERLHRLILMDYQNLLQVYQNERDQLEENYIKETELAGANTPELRELVDKIFQESMIYENFWFESTYKKYKEEKPKFGLKKWRYKRYWNKLNKDAKIPLEY